MIKILPTIGPASNSINSLRKILKFTNTVRLNGSHNNVSWHVKTSINIKKLNQNCKILIDLPGIKPRTENLDFDQRNYIPSIFTYKINSFVF